LFTAQSVQLQENARSVIHVVKKVLPLKAGPNSFWTKWPKMASYVKQKNLLRSFSCYNQKKKQMVIWEYTWFQRN